MSLLYHYCVHVCVRKRCLHSPRAVSDEHILSLFVSTCVACGWASVNQISSIVSCGLRNKIKMAFMDLYSPQLNPIYSVLGLTCNTTI